MIHHGSHHEFTIAPDMIEFYTWNNLVILMVQVVPEERLNFFFLHKSFESRGILYLRSYPKHNWGSHIILEIGFFTEVRPESNQVILRQHKNLENPKFVDFDVFVETREGQFDRVYYL